MRPTFEAICPQCHDPLTSKPPTGPTGTVFHTNKGFDEPMNSCSQWMCIICLSTSDQSESPSLQVAPRDLMFSTELLQEDAWRVPIVIDHNDSQNTCHSSVVLVKPRIWNPLPLPRRQGKKKKKVLCKFLKLLHHGSPHFVPSCQDSGRWLLRLFLPTLKKYLELGVTRT